MPLENEIASALQQTISAAVSLGAKVAMKGAMRNVKQKGMRSENHNKGFSNEAIGSMNAIGNQMIKSVVMMAITASSAGALERDRNERRAENEAGKTAMHESIADPDSSDEGAIGWLGAPCIKCVINVCEYSRNEQD